jgi:protein-disulfide isomerase
VSSRVEEKKRLRAEREAAERAEQMRARRSRRIAMLASAMAVAAAVVVIAIVVSSGGSPKTTGPAAGKSATASLLDGIPQQGATLGASNAPVTMVEYADLRCPICKEYTLSAFPALVQQDVRSGKLKIVMKLQTFVGQQYAPGDSARAAAYAIAAGKQNRMWQFVDLFYRNQQDETSTYVTDPFLRRLSAAVPGLDATRALRDQGSAAVKAAVAKDGADFNKAGFTGTPSFQIGRTGGPLQTLNADPTDPNAFTSAVAQLST